MVTAAIVVPTIPFVLLVKVVLVAVTLLTNVAITLVVLVEIACVPPLVPPVGVGVVVV